jgi:DNA-binding HxlR family transcriptional regulator
METQCKLRTLKSSGGVEVTSGMGGDVDLGQMRLLLDLLADKWTVPVLGVLCAQGGQHRFNAIRRDLPAISQKSLVACLRRLEMNGLLRRTVCTTGRLTVEYAVTPLGHTLDGPVEALLAWSTKHGAEVAAAQEAFLKREDDSNPST